jgi:hypothetical protein
MPPPNRCRRLPVEYPFSDGLSEIEDTPFGTSYTVEGAMATPDGRAVQVRVVWFIDSGEALPRLVTAYPLKGAVR